MKDNSLVSIRRTVPNLVAAIVCILPTAAAYAQGDPNPVRNDVAQPGQEVLMLRHQYLERGTHQAYYAASRDGVWPWYEKIGARIVGQWQVIHPDGSAAHPEFDEGYRLARYASYKHWQATRAGANAELGGNGPDRVKNNQALRERERYSRGSTGGIFLEGHMAPGGPYFLPGLDENFELVDDDSAEPSPGAPQPVRNDVMQPGEEIVTMRYWKIEKGTFDTFFEASRDGVWPYFEKLGARVIGQWKVVYYPQGAPVESPDYDEVYMMTRYASYEHWQATRSAASLGGNGPDFDKFREALRIRRGLTIETSLQYLKGYLYQSPPKFMPGLGEAYRAVEGTN